MGIEPTSSAWKAEVLPLNYTRGAQTSHSGCRGQISSSVQYAAACASHQRESRARQVVEGGGFEPPKAEPADLQSAPFDRSGTPPTKVGKSMKFSLKFKHLSIDQAGLNWQNNMLSKRGSNLS